MFEYLKTTKDILPIKIVSRKQKLNIKFVFDLTYKVMEYTDYIVFIHSTRIYISLFSCFSKYLLQLKPNRIFGFITKLSTLSKCVKRKIWFKNLQNLNSFLPFYYVLPLLQIYTLIPGFYIKLWPMNNCTWNKLKIYLDIIQSRCLL